MKLQNDLKVSVCGTSSKLVSLKSVLQNEAGEIEMYSLQPGFYSAKNETKTIFFAAVSGKLRYEWSTLPVQFNQICEASGQMKVIRSKSLKNNIFHLVQGLQLVSLFIQIFSFVTSICLSSEMRGPMVNYVFSSKTCTPSAARKFRNSRMHH